MCIQHRVVDHLLVRGHADDAVATVRALYAAHELDDVLALGDGRCRGPGVLDRLHGVGVDGRVQRTGCIEVRGIDLDVVGAMALAHERGAAQVGDLVDGLAGVEAARDVGDLSLGVAIDQQVGLGIHEHRAAHFFAPVVEVRDAAQRSFDATDDDGHVLVGLARALRIHDDRAVRPLATLAARRVRVIAAHPAVGGVAVDHRVHVAGGDAEEQARPAQRSEGLGALPVRLGDHADAQALGLEQATDDGHAEAGVIDVGVTTDDDDVAFIPAQRIHLFAAHG